MPIHGAALAAVADSTPQSEAVIAPAIVTADIGSEYHATVFPSVPAVDESVTSIGAVEPATVFLLHTLIELAVPGEPLSFHRVVSAPLGVAALTLEVLR